MKRIGLGVQLYSLKFDLRFLIGRCDATEERAREKKRQIQLSNFLRCLLVHFIPLAVTFIYLSIRRVKVDSCLNLFFCWCNLQCNTASNVTDINATPPLMFRCHS